MREFNQKRGMQNLTSHLCVIRRNLNESANHLFFECRILIKLWSEVLSLLDF